MATRELLFWGGGHLLQFVTAIVLVANWRILSLRSLGDAVADDRVFRLAVALIALIAIPGPFFYALFEPFSAAQHEAFRLLQFAIVAPTLVFAISLVAKARTLGPLARCRGAIPPSSRSPRRSRCSRSAASWVS